MDFRFTPAQEQFRQEVRSFLKEWVPKFAGEARKYEREGEEDDARFSPGFSRLMGQKGWIGLAWPREHGGRGLSHIERLIFNEECIYNRAPTAFHVAAERQFAPSIMVHGTEEQKRSFIPRIARGEIGFAIGYTEPNVGSDLASLETRATQDGDDYVISGQKLWAGGAHVADYIWLAARTNPNSPKHKGISVFIVDMKTPGIRVRPFRSMAEGRYNEIFFDNIRVPASTMIGEKDRGWYVVASNLDLERSGIERVLNNYLLLEDVLAFCQETRSKGETLANMPLVRSRLADRFIETEAGRMLSYRVAWVQNCGMSPGHEASTAKLFGSELGQRIAGTCIQIMGIYGQLGKGSKWAPLKGRVEHRYLASMSDTIRGGTSEVQRTILARRGLGLGVG